MDSEKTVETKQTEKKESPEDDYLDQKEQDPLPINEETLLEYKADLIEALKGEKKDELKVLQIIKLLKKSKITIPLLKSTTIGKVMTNVVEKPKDFFSKSEIQPQAENLLNIWKEMNRQRKLKKEAEKQKEAPYEIPYIPPKIEKEIIQMDARGKFVRRFIEVLQEYPQGDNDDGPAIRHSNAKIEEAASVGLAVGKKLLELYGSQKVTLLQKFRVLLFTLQQSNPFMRLKLLDGSIKPDKFVAMNEEDLVDD